MRAYKTLKPFDVPSFDVKNKAIIVSRDIEDNLIQKFSPKTMFNILIDDSIDLDGALMDPNIPELTLPQIALIQTTNVNSFTFVYSNVNLLNLDF